MKFKCTRYQFKDLASFRYGKMPNKKKISSNGLYPIYSGYRYVGYYDEYNIEPKQLIVVARGVGGTGDVKIIKERCYLTNLSIAVEITAYDKVVPEYLYYLFALNNLRYLDSGSAQSQITINDLEKVSISLPDIIIQRKIVDILSALDDKIETNTAINKNLEEQAQAIFKSWFIEAKNRDTWKTGTFSDIIESTLGGDWGKEYSVGNYTEKVYCVRGADIPEVRNGNKGKMPTRYILPKNFKLKRLVPDDIVVEISGGSPTQSTGRVAAISQSLLNRYDKGMVCTNFCRAIKPRLGYSMFVYYYWQYLYEKNVFFSYENGTTGIKNLDLNGFISTEEIMLPPNDLISKFDVICQTYFDEVFSRGLENEKLSELRDTLLPRLMSGEIDVSDIEI